MKSFEFLPPIEPNLENINSGGNVIILCNVLELEISMAIEIGKVKKQNIIMPNKKLQCKSEQASYSNPDGVARRTRRAPNDATLVEKAIDIDNTSWLLLFSTRDGF